MRRCIRRFSRKLQDIPSVPFPWIKDTSVSTGKTTDSFKDNRDNTYFHTKPQNQKINDDHKNRNSPEEKMNTAVKEEEENEEVLLTNLRKKLKYQSTYRGMLEMDTVLGTFASEERLGSMNKEELLQYDQILREYDNDLNRWLVNSEAAPERIQEMSVYQDLVKFMPEIAEKLLKMQPYPEIPPDLASKIKN